MIPSGLRCCLGQRQVLLRPNESVNSKYLYWALQSPFVQQQISWNEGTGTTVSNVRIPVLKSLLIPRRGAEEDVIAEVLSSLADKVQLNHQINEALEQIAQAIFKSWFVDFEPVKAKIAARQRWHALQPVAELASPVCYADDEVSLPDLETYMNLAAMQAISGKDEEQLAQMQTEQPAEYAELLATAELFPSAMQESELGEIPVGWTAGKLEDVAAYGKGRVPVSDLALDTYISTECMVENKKGVSPASSLPSVDTVPSFSKNQILVSNIRPYFKKIWFADHAGGRSPDVLGFEYRGDRGHEFLFNVLYQDAFFDYMMRTSKGAKMPRGDKKAIMEFELVVPSRQLITHFSQSVSGYYRLASFKKGENETLEAIRDLLLPKLLSGELALHKVEESQPELAETPEPADV